VSLFPQKCVLGSMKKAKTTSFKLSYLAEKKDIDLTMHEDLVSVRADSRPYNATFIGNLYFPIKVDLKKAEATFKEGLLSMQIPVKERRSPPTSIKIK
jgi:HSP20 family molecular chaperone IbpA